MAFDKKVPTWGAPGVEPPESKKQEGWQVNDKPPAAWWNWFMNLTSEALKELQEKAAEQAWVQEQINAIDVDIQDASLTQKGIVQLSSALNSISESLAATPKAVKSAYDEALAAKQLGVEQKANVVAALNSIGVPASTSESWAQLIPKIAAIIRATGNATAADLLAGKSASNAGGPFNGSMPNRSAENHHMPGSNKTVWPGDRYFIQPPAGYYDGASWVTAAEPQLVPENIRAGANIGGVNGNLQEGVKYATGTIGIIYPLNNQPVDCGFIPRVFVVSGLVQGFDSRASTYIYQTADGIDRTDAYGGNYLYILTRTLQQVMTVRANNADRYVQNVIWQAWG